MPSYEMVYVLRPTIPDDEIDQAIERVNGVIVSRGGTIEKTDLWGRRRLAYPLKDHREGIYVLTNFASPPQATKEIESQLRITDEVLRHLVIRRDED
ncbi:MAG: 30S ribosomal protein S6 [Dehalococcoidia bacterium]|nr:MAG: 30S ribosomal protein S6 [Dehalococcoidia bacterium]